jgi:predicted phage-related endonuclease
MGAHLDRIILGRNGIIEAKTTKAEKIAEWGEPGTDEVPPEYFIQGQHNMAVSGRDFCDYPVSFGGQKLLVYTVARDETFIENMIRLEYENVWQYVERGELPPPVTSDEANRRWPTSKEGEVQAAEGDIINVQQLVMEKEKVKVLTAHCEGLELAIKKAIGDTGDTLMAGTKKLCTWKSSKGYRVEAYDVKPSRKLLLAKQK